MNDRGARFDRRLARIHGIRCLVGVDEVGRGCLAGPVVVAAVALTPGCDLPGVDDSKRMTPAARERAYLRIQETAVDWAVVCVSQAEVDRRNVLAASLWGMQRALSRLSIRPELILVDGNRLPDEIEGPALPLIGGDGRSLCIAAASVMAKVLRDRIMRVWDRHHPGYGFVRHVGYPTPEHRAALERLGPCALHRQSFAPVRAAASQKRLPLD